MLWSVKIWTTEQFLSFCLYITPEITDKMIRVRFLNLRPEMGCLPCTPAGSNTFEQIIQHILTLTVLNKRRLNRFLPGELLSGLYFVFMGLSPSCWHHEAES